MLTLATILAALVLLAGTTFSAQAPTAGAVPVDEAPAALAPAIERARETMSILQQTLQAKLMDAIATGGPAAAVPVCGREAYLLAANVAEQQGIAVGRTSHALRNPKNAPRAWAAEIVAGGKGVPFAKAHGWAVDLGDRIGVLQPIGTRETCIICHGAPSAMPDDVAAALRKAYPDDHAIGFAPGDLRGWLWAEVPKPAGATARR